MGHACSHLFTRLVWWLTMMADASRWCDACFKQVFQQIFYFLHFRFFTVFLHNDSVWFIVAIPIPIIVIIITVFINDENININIIIISCCDLNSVPVRHMYSQPKLSYFHTRFANGDSRRQKMCKKRDKSLIKIPLPQRQ